VVPWLIGDARLKDLRHDCGAPVTCNDDYNSRRDVIERFDVVTNALLVTGGLTLVVAACAYLLDSRKSKSASRLSAQVGPGLAGVTHRTAF
jgi:hypothetical protein